MENRIELRFGTSTKDLTGNSLGRKTFEIQVRPHWRENEINIVIIPEEIEDIGSSFIQGIYTFLKETYGKSEALEQMKLECNRTSIMDKIEKSIKAYGI